MQNKLKLISLASFCLALAILGCPVVWSVVDYYFYIRQLQDRRLFVLAVFFFRFTGTKIGGNPKKRKKT